VVVTPSQDAKHIRIRLLNGGSEAPWRIDGTKLSAEMEILATDGHDVERGQFTTKFVLGLANRFDILVKLEDDQDLLITAIQMKHSGDVVNPALRHIVIRGTNTPEDEQIIIKDLPTYDEDEDQPSTFLKNFNIMANLTAIHPLVDREPTRTFTVFNQGGDQYGGFPLIIYEGLIITPEGKVNKNLVPLTGKIQNYTQLNHLKFQLPPYKLYRHNETNEFVSTRRPCAGCENSDNIPYNKYGIRPRPPLNNDGTYDISYDFEFKNADNTTDRCCWEWCDVPSDQCDHYKLEEVKYYEPNKNYIPVCYGDRVRIQFINAASFENDEGHPMHLHGHDFVLRQLYNITKSDTTELNTDNTGFSVEGSGQNFNFTGPRVDTIWVPYNQALVFDFDAFNPGEHLFHCHNDFHLENGMMTTIRYMHDDYCETMPKHDLFKGGFNKYPTQFCNMAKCGPGSTLVGNQQPLPEEL